mgnify:CR=1 FL=1
MSMEPCAVQAHHGRCLLGFTERASDLHVLSVLKMSYYGTYISKLTFRKEHRNRLHDKHREKNHLFYYQYSFYPSWCHAGWGCHIIVLLPDAATIEIRKKSDSPSSCKRLINGSSQKIKDPSRRRSFHNWMTRNLLTRSTSVSISPELKI